LDYTLHRSKFLKMDLSNLSFVAIDFETASRHPDSACSIGMVLVESGKITDEKIFLIKPPSELFEFSYIHGLTWEDVKTSPTFNDLWPDILKFISRGSFIAAHNASFDKRVLHYCLKRYHLDIPEISFLCTVALARKNLNIHPANLRSVADHLALELNHHEALSDARASAKIVLEVIKRQQFNTSKI